MAFEPRDAVEFLQQVMDAESGNRADALDDLRFRYGDQWPTEIQNSRHLEARPCLTINETDSYIRQVTNNQRQQRPRIKVHAMNDIADPKIAEVLTGITRHIEVNSNADNAYDIAFDFAATMGFGYWRVVTDYVREDSFDQDIFIRSIQNPFSVYFDNNSVLPDGSDAQKCLIADMLPLSQFRKLYPGADDTQFTARGAGDLSAEWVTKDDIRIAEYFCVDLVRDKLVMLSDKSVLYASQMPPSEVLIRAGVEVIGDRDSFRRSVMWRKVTASEVLEEKKWPGRWIPVVPVYGTQIIIDGKLRRMGLVRNAKDPQRMVNFWQSALTESIALAPKAKWLMAEGQDEGHESEWAQANTAARPVLRYKQTDIDGRDAPQPMRLQPEPPPAGVIEAAMAASNNLQKVMGMFDPAIRNTQPQSGKAIRAEQMQSDNSNFHYYDNLTNSIKHTGRIILDLVPKVVDTERVMRIIGDDGKPDLVTVNQPQQVQDETGQAVERILNDVTIGQYDVEMDVGPGYNTKRMEAIDAFSGLMQGPMGEEIAKIGGDLVVRLYDAPGMEALADRMAAANPLSQIDKQSDIPPQAQMLIKQLQSQLRQAQQQLQAAAQEIKLKAGLVQLQENAETQREHMRLAVKAHDIETEDAGWKRDVAARTATSRHDTETKALTAQNVAEIRGMVELLKAKLDAAQFEKQADREDAQLREKSNETEHI
jgi:hypothetical protein